MDHLSERDAAKPRRRRPETRNFCLRLTDAEKRLLLERAGRLPLGAFIRSVLLDEKATKRRQSRNPLADDTALARVLAGLGQSRLANNLNQLAKAVNIGALPVTPETESEIVSACSDVAAMRQDLIRALGLKGDDHP